MKISSSLLLLLIIFSWACESTPDQYETGGHVTISQTNEIVLIFLNSPDNGYFRNGASGPYSDKKFDLSYVNDFYQLEKIELDHSQEFDTIRIQTQRKFIELTHQYRALGEIPFLAANGDTILFSYDTLGMPIPKLLHQHRTVGLFDYSFPQFTRKTLYKDHFSALEKAENLIFFLNRDKPNFNLIAEIPLQQSELMTYAEREYEKEALLLDSIFSATNGNMSEEVYEFYKATISLKGACLGKGAEPQRIITQLQNHSEKWGATRSFRSTLDTYFVTYLEPQVAWIHDGKRQYRDYKSLFDTVASDSSLSGIIRDMMLQKCLEGIYGFYAKEELENAITRYSQIAGEGIPVEIVRRQFNLEQITSGIPADTDETEFRFEEFVDRQAGNVVVVDFWASWCAPCIESFPDAKALQREYSEKPVTFVFLAIDENVDSWNNNEWKYELGENSFWVKNKANQAFLEPLDVRTIPRYLLYDKEGKLVHRNAPGPGSMEIRELLDRYLDE